MNGLLLVLPSQPECTAAARPSDFGKLDVVESGASP
jgi:hypothetical protein